ncbi:MAG: discoidin domain-containing protein [Saprospiraceae bacterium]|nr:discoidin domain-containing protein [Saprospiraceae bacterium]
MLTKILIWTPFFFIIILFSCNSIQPESKLEATLREAGANRSELEKVLAHYQETGDSLKYKAAVFLIENLSNGYSYYGGNIAQYDPIFAEINGMDVGRAIELVFDKYEEKYEPLDLEKLERLTDARTATADFLIENIDLAFEAWQSNPASKDVDFDLFCKAILPHRASNEQLESWRPLFQKHFAWLKDSLENPADFQEILGKINRHLAEDFKITLKWRYPFMPKYSNMMNCSVGTCDVMASMQVSALRALGVPAFKDFVPRWGNKEYGHAWVAVLDSQGNPYWCFDEYDDYARNDGPIASSYIHSDSISTRYLSPDFKVDSLKTVPKVYRNTIYDNPDQIKLINSPHADEILDMFKDPRLHDVTHLYLKDCQDITIVFEKVPRGVHFAYLGVFNKQEWEAVAIAEIIDNKALFKNVGQNITFVPFGIKRGKQIALAPAFYFKNGNKIELKPNPDEPQNGKIERKTNFFANTLEKANMMIRGRFEGANKADFSDAEILYNIERTPLYIQNIEINNPKPFRYVRYKAPTDRPNSGDIAELEFYNDINKNAQKLNGNIIGTKDILGVTREMAMDGDWDTYFHGAEKKDNWVGLDLGKAQSIKKIKFCPRNDTNIILPGDTYVLYYWNDKWVSLGTKKASETFLEFNNIPSNALLWLRNISGGQEENIFIMKNERQVFF